MQLYEEIIIFEYKGNDKGISTIQNKQNNLNLINNSNFKFHAECRKNCFSESHIF